MLRAVEDFGGHRVIVTKGAYKSKKGFVVHASHFGVYVDLDYKPLRVLMEPSELKILNDDGKVDKKKNQNSL